MASSEIEKLERLVRENPKGRQFAILADAYRKDGQFQRALDVLAPGLEVHPDYVSARVVLGRVLMAMGDTAKAQEAFSRVVELDPESVIALKALADLAEERGDGGEALKRASQLLTVDPGNEEAQKQIDRLSTQVPAEAAPADAPESSVPPVTAQPDEVRLSGIVPMMPEEEKTAAPFEAVKPPIAKTKEIPAIDLSAPKTAPAFTAAVAPLEQAPEPLPIAPLSEEAQVEKTIELVRPLSALEPTAFEGTGADTPTERMAGLDPVGMSEEEVRSIGAASGFEPTSGPLDTNDIPAAAMPGLETTAQVPAIGDEIGLEQQQEIELGAGATNEFQDSSVAETLRRSSGANEFQVSSDSDTLGTVSGENPYQVSSDADQLGAGAMPEMERSNDLAFIHPPAEEEPIAPGTVAEPEPVVTESMAELYASQGHLTEALEVYRQLAALDPTDSRYAERMVELEMFAGGAPAPVEETNDLDLPPAPLDMEPIPVEMLAPTPPARPVAMPVATPSATWDASATGGTPVLSWLSEVFAGSLSATPAPEAESAPMMMEVEAEVPPMAMDDEVPESSTPLPLIMPPAEEPVATPPVPAAPMGQPTRPASGSFDLNNVFGEARSSTATPAPDSFDSFFGAPAATPAAAPNAPAPNAPSIRTSRANPTPPAGGEDDLSSFQDWLKGLKK